MYIMQSLQRLKVCDITEWTVKILSHEMLYIAS